MSKKVLGIIGSPRRNGNTDALVDIILESARENGGETEKLYLADMDIRHCQECLYCRRVTPRTCAIEDDMHGIIDKLNEADIWVLGTPVFWWGPTGLFKDFMDRWYGFPLDCSNKKIIVAIPSAEPEKEVARSLIGMFDDSFEYKETKAYAYIHAGGAKHPGDLAKLTEVIAQAKAVGAAVMTD